MVEVLAVGMPVACSLVCVPVRMLEGERFVCMIVVPIVVAMEMFVLDWLVFVVVLVPFGQVQDSTDPEKSGSQQEAPVEDALAQDTGDSCTDEGRYREHRSRSTRANAPLCAEVQSQAHAVSS